MLSKQEILLSPIQQIKLELYREFGNNAKEVFDFIIDDKAVYGVVASECNTSSKINNDTDGVYIVYKDNSYELFTGDNSKENVKYIGLIHNGRRIAIALHDLGSNGKEFQFLKDKAGSPEYSDFYTSQRGISAFEDFDGVNNTKHIKNDYDSEIPFELLEENEYIPSLGEFGLMMMFASHINKALEYVGGMSLKTWYWSSTEAGRLNAWVVSFSDGNTTTYVKFYSNSVRAVAAF